MLFYNLENPRFWLFLGLFLLFLVSFLMFIPTDWLFSSENIEDSAYLDKIIHTLVFTFLVSWFSGQVKITISFFVVISVYGLFTECVQYYLPYRSLEWLDILFNQIGIICGFIIGKIFLNGWSVKFEEVMSKNWIF